SRRASFRRSNRSAGNRLASLRHCTRCGAELPETPSSPGGWCGDCLPTFDQSTPLQLEPATGTQTDAVGVEVGSPPQLRIGPYTCLSLLGTGGMGIVYLAEQQQPIRRRVALKIIKRGMGSKQVIARFESERQALALMSHPGIARVFDAGTTDEGRPYFVMEHVPGIPITAYCDRHSLTVVERLMLLTDVCEAIQHAHTKGVIHRDIKPSNVLVAMEDGRPWPKVIDFGLAKAVRPDLPGEGFITQVGAIVGTPGYMSPEQCEPTSLDVDTRTDIYSLGVLAYELLIGVPPFDPERLREGGWAEMQRIIREEEPLDPSKKLAALGSDAIGIAEHRRTTLPALLREISGELDWITLKALEKDRARRYQSPSELGADIQRYFHLEPVSAGPPSRAYRLRKMVRRHRRLFAAGAALFATLVAGLV